MNWKRHRNTLLLTVMSLLASCSTVQQSQKPRSVKKVSSKINSTVQKKSKVDQVNRKDLVKATQRNIQKILSHHVGLFRKCYEQHMNKEKSGHLGGKVDLVFDLDKQGNMIRAGVSDSSLPLKLKSCLVTAIWSVKFTPTLHGRGVKVRQPMDFQVQ